MSELAIIVQAVLPILIVAGLGAGLRRLGWLTSQADASLLSVTVNLLTPCLILDKLTGSAALERPSALVVAPVLGFVAVALSVMLCLGAARVFALGSAAVQRTFALSAGLQNYAYLPLPLALSLYGDETAAMLFVHNVGVEVAIWTLGVSVLAGARPGAMGRKLLSPPALAIALALALNATLGRARLPGFLMDSVGLVGSAAIPMGLLLTGATMADDSRKLGGPGAARTALLAIALRLGLLPLLYCGAIWLLHTSSELERVLVLQAAMPAAVIPIILTKHYGGDSVTALRVVFSTTFGALITMPLWIHFASRFVDAP